ncbi:hypothetical protein DFH09DRAFT_1444598, partial [Mycena vulgaris]
LIVHVESSAGPLRGAGARGTPKRGLARLPRHRPRAERTMKTPSPFGGIFYSRGRGAWTASRELEHPLSLLFYCTPTMRTIPCPACGRRRARASLQLPHHPHHPPPTVDDRSAASAARAEVIFDARKMRAVEHGLKLSIEPATSSLWRALAARRTGRAAHLPHICAKEPRRASGLDNAEHPPGSLLSIHQRGPPAPFAHTGTTRRPAAVFVDVATAPAPGHRHVACTIRTCTRARPRARRPNDRAAHPQRVPPPPPPIMRPPAPCTLHRAPEPHPHSPHASSITRAFTAAARAEGPSVTHRASHPRCIARHREPTRAGRGPLRTGQYDSARGLPFATRAFSTAAVHRRTSNTRKRAPRVRAPPPRPTFFAQEQGA